MRLEAKQWSALLQPLRTDPKGKLPQGELQSGALQVGLWFNVVILAAE